MTLFKFLAAGAIGPFSGVAWPAPGGWLEAAGPLATRGVHVCRAGELAHWLSDELWEVEVAGAQVAGYDSWIAERARLIRRIDAWDAAGAARFAAACIAHARAGGPSALLDDAVLAAAEGYVAIAAYCAAAAIGKRAGEAGYRAERAWQGGWIARELIGA
jgi:hypothetical protein